MEPHATDNIASRAETNSLALSIENTIGGLIFNTLCKGPSVLINIWYFSLISKAMFEARSAAGANVSLSITNSIPTNNPKPLHTYYKYIIHNKITQTTTAKYIIITEKLAYICIVSNAIFE